MSGCRKAPGPLALPGGAEAAYAVGRAMGLELGSVGIDIDYAPVLDVHSNPANPVIGDRAFGSEPGATAACALAIRGPFPMKS